MFNLVNHQTGHYMWIKGTIHQEYKTNTNMHASKVGALNFMK
jgi:hypothetical protein